MADLTVYGMGSDGWGPVGPSDDPVKSDGSEFIPTATTSVQGKALKANNPGTQPAIPQIGTLVEIQNIGVELAGGPWHTFNFPAGGVADAGGGIATINAAGAPGPTGPTGPTGGVGGPGPPGPGFTSFATSGSAAQDVPNGAITNNFGIGFSWKMASGGVSVVTEAAAYDGIYVASVVGFNTTNVAVNMIGADAAAGPSFFRSWMQASG